MATVRFYIRDKKINKPQSIYLVYNLSSNDKFVYPTNFKILPKYWNTNKYRVKNIAEITNKELINNFLNDLQNATDNFILQLKADRQTITKAKLRAFADKYFNKNENQNFTFLSFIKYFIKERKTHINPKINKIVSPRTIQTYEIALKHLQDYEKTAKTTLDFKNIDLDFYLDFVNFLQKKKLSTNTIGKQIKTLKVFLNEATARKINTNEAYKSTRFKTITEESDQIYLTEIELKKLAKLDLSNNTKLDKIRDVFLIACWTGGVRYSDYKQINRQNIKDGLLHIKQQKTGSKIAIPLHPDIEKIIIDKYNFDLPKIITNQKFNKYLKELGNLAEINTPTTKEITKAGLKISKTLPKYKFISTHTARRSFATNLYNQGIATVTIMAITGHKTEKSFLKYIKVTPTEHAIIIQKHWQKQGTYLEVVNK